MPAPVDLGGRVAIVTGAAGGLGATLVRVLEGAGALVVATDVQGDGVVHADIRSEEGNRLLVAEALARHGRIDALVLNAGAQFMAPIPEFPLEEWDRLMDVMVKGPFLLMKHGWPHVARPGGRIVATASGSTYIAERYKSAYVAAKHGIAGLIKVAALEGGPLGMTANAVAPGWMRTPMVQNQLEDQVRLRGLTAQEVMEDMVERHPVKRFVEPEEVANAIAFLCSDAASGINGAILPVDLGTIVC
jgi:3-hydroxybutyrate dehydrogenase